MKWLAYLGLVEENSRLYNPWVYRLAAGLAVLAAVLTVLVRAWVITVLLLALVGLMLYIATKSKRQAPEEGARPP